ncbi:MAG: hypothetical protein ACI4IL_02050 [Eubacterium sp.]
MTIDELACEYEAQYRILSARLDALTPLLCIYRGEDLRLLRRKIKIYYEMACECKRVSSMLKGKYPEDFIYD